MKTSSPSVSQVSRSASIAVRADHGCVSPHPSRRPGAGSADRFLEYLDERFADRGLRLLPATVEDRFAAREIAAFVSSFMQPFQLPGVTRRRMVEVFGLEHHALGADGACRAFTRAHLEATLPELDRLVSRRAGRSSIGDAPTLADCAVFPQLIGAKSFGVDVKAFGALARIYEECMALPAFADSLPERQIDAPGR